jgi:glycosyltransferase involved in cell wall biosynthesis
MPTPRSFRERKAIRGEFMPAPRLPKASIILATYNWPHALALSLQSLNDQDHLDFEVIVADDGSSPETSNIIESFSKTARFQLRHVWQPDDGFRVAQIRNKAIAMARGNYLVITDGDCLFLPGFVREHLAMAEPSFFVAGKRSWLKEELSRRILHEDLCAWRWSRITWLGKGLTNQCTRPMHFLTLPLGPFRKLQTTQWRKAQTCNLAVWRDDCMAINGFDETFIGHGLEDSDLVVRLLRRGVRRKSGAYGAPVLHLWHPRPQGRGPSGNRHRFAETLNGSRIRARQGLSGGPAADGPHAP